MKTPKRSTLNNRLDKLFGQVVRKKRYCQRCGRHDNTLQTAHIFSRAYKSVRWEQDNAFCLCAGCHFWVHKNPILFAEFVLKLYGKAKYEALKRKAKRVKKWQISELQTLVKKMQQML